MLAGYMGKILRVNLSTSKILEEPLKEELAATYVGGYGTGGRILLDEVPPWVEPFDPSNKLIFSTGPLTGTIAPTAGRHCVVTKSPLTGYFGDASAGGYWGAELKFAGFDMLVVTGRASRPVFINIREDGYMIKDASAYWGMDARAADRAIRADLGDKMVKVADIGQAGERMSRIAGILNDDAGRIAARCGVGAVMGFMNLKAVAVRGHKKVPVADQATLMKVAVDTTKLARTDPKAQSFTQRGTPGGFEGTWVIGDTPSHNWLHLEFGGPGDPSMRKLAWTPEGYEIISAGNRTCYICPISCRRVSTVAEGPYTIEANVEGPEYESVAALGSNCGVDDIRAVAKMNDLCNLYGLDTISLGGVISFAMECYEKGILTKEDAGGLDLRFGNAEAAIELLHRVGRREGLGDILAEGVRRASKIIGNGSEEYAIHVKGQEIAMHDPRAAQGMGLHYACTITGGRHTEGFSLPVEQKGDRFATAGKGKIVKDVEDWRAFQSICGWCVFAKFGGNYGGDENYVKAYTAVTGLPLALPGALALGDRVFTLRKMFNMGHGCTKSEDTLPKRLLTEPGRAGTPVKLQEMLPEYYKARGWDEATSMPTNEKLLQLGLDDLIRTEAPMNT